MRMFSTKNGVAYHATRCFGAKAHTIDGAFDAKATGQQTLLMSLADMATVATEKNPGARPGF